MIKATFYKNSDKQYIGFSVIGHAGFAASGRDIICAGVSTLTINTINAIEKLTDDKYKTDIEESGSIRFRFVDDSSSDGQLLVKAMELGILGISDEYGKKFVEVHYKEV